MNQIISQAIDKALAAADKRAEEIDRAAASCRMQAGSFSARNQVANDYATAQRLNDEAQKLRDQIQMVRGWLHDKPPVAGSDYPQTPIVLPREAAMLAVQECRRIVETLDSLRTTLAGNVDTSTHQTLIHFGVQTAALADRIALASRKLTGGRA